MLIYRTKSRHLKLSWVMKDEDPWAFWDSPSILFTLKIIEP
jgi:hypothetical protein